MHKKIVQMNKQNSSNEQKNSSNEQIIEFKWNIIFFKNSNKHEIYIYTGT